MPRSVEVADTTLRQPARWLITSTGIESVTQIRRDDIEDAAAALAHRTPVVMQQARDKGYWSDVRAVRRPSPF